MQLDKRPIWKPHEGCIRKGNWRIVKDGTKGNIYEFSCDECTRFWAVFDIKTLSQEDQESINSLFSEIKRREKQNDKKA